MFLASGTWDVVCVSCGQDSDCDDGVACNGVETCVDNWCNTGTSPCADGLLCDKTIDRCSECLNNGHCDDGVACNGAEACVDGACVAGTSPSALISFATRR